MLCHTMFHTMVNRMADLRARWVTPLLWVLGAVAFATTAHGQTLFARPDTTPDYAAYQHIEECLTAMFRVDDAQRSGKNTFWPDTASIADWKRYEQETGNTSWDMMTPWPESVVQAGKACLARFNADTATVQSVRYGKTILQALLMVNRDQDAQRFTQRFVEAMRVRSARDHKDALHGVLETYIKTGPVRFPEAKQYYTQLLAALQGDSLYRTIDADLLFAGAAAAVKDTALKEELWWHAIRANDATPVEERKGSPSSSKRLIALAYAVGFFTQDEGLDSLARSTLAYNLYRANTVERRVYGGAVSVATDEQVKPYKVPDLLGENSYTATTGASPGPLHQGLAAYTKQGAVPPGALPVNNRINFMTGLPSHCHTESAVRSIDIMNQKAIGGKACLGFITSFRRLKERYPDIEIILLTDTYGHVGQLGPLQPADEADTLAKLFLGHHRVPGHLVVNTTPFFHVEEPDGRRVDLPTPQSEAFGDNDVANIYIDKEGYRVKMFEYPGTEWFKRAYEILQNRPSK